MSRRSLGMIAPLLTALVLVGCGLIDNPQRDREQLEAARRSGDYRAAAVIARNLTDKNPRDAGLRLVLAGVLADAGDYKGAYQEAERAEALGLSPSQTSIVMAQSLIGQGQYQRALDIASGNDSFSTNTVEMARVRGWAYIGLNRPAEARTELDTALRAEPGDLPTLLALAAAIEQDEDTNAAVAMLRKAARLDPNNLPLQLELGKLETRAGDPAAAKTFAAVVAAANKRHDDNLAQVAIEYAGVDALQRRDLAGARDALAALTRMAPESDAALGMRARLALVEGKSAEADAALNSLLKRNPESVETRLLIAGSYLQQGKYDIARGALKEILAANPRDLRARRMLADIAVSDRLRSDGPLATDPQAAREESKRLELAERHIAAGRFADAVSTLQAVIKPTARERLLLVRALVGAGDATEAGRAAEALASQAPDSDAESIMSAEAMLLVGRKPRAIALLEQLRKRRPASASIWLAMSQLEGVLGRPQQAASDLAIAAERDPNDASIRLQSARAAIGRHDAATAVRLLEPLAQESPGSAAVLAELASAYLMQRRLPDAERTANEALTNEPNAWLPRSVLASTALMANRGDEAREQIKLLARVRPPPEVLGDLQGELAASIGDFGAAAREFGQAYAARPSGALAQKEFRARLAGNQPDPAGPLRRWIARSPDDASSRALLAQFTESTGDAAGAERAYVAVLRDDANNLIALNNLAWMRLQQGKHAEALHLAGNAFRVGAASPQVADTYGWALAESGRAKEAVPILRDALTKLPRNPMIRYHLAVALASSGSQDEAITHLELLTSGGAVFAEQQAARELLDKLRAAARG
ncbi:MAG: tetratricopeptide repeat protein [Pseudomonadales bacterium]|nr:tetratricopeptide repeat protein [Pseudomonadales bacterium]